MDLFENLLIFLDSSYFTYQYYFISVDLKLCYTKLDLRIKIVDCKIQMRMKKMSSDILIRIYENDIMFF